MECTTVSGMGGICPCICSCVHRKFGRTQTSAGCLCRELGGFGRRVETAACYILSYLLNAEGHECPDSAKNKDVNQVSACPSPHTLQVSCSASRLPGNGQTNTGAASLQEPPSYPPVQVIQARVSSSSSSQVSSINSDLEVRGGSAGGCTRPPSPGLARASMVPASLYSSR